MLSGNDILGIPILTERDTGDQEHVKDWIYDIQNKSLLGFLIDPGGWLGGARVLAWENIQQVTPQAVIVERISPIIRLDQILHISQILQRATDVIGLPISTLHGENLGEIMDIYFDEITGEVLGYAVHGPIRTDGLNATFVPAVEPLRIVDDNAFVTSEVIELMQESKNVMRSQVTDLHEAEGLRVRQAVRSDGGFLIATIGQIVTDAVIDDAREAGRGPALLQAVGVIESR